MSAFDLARLRRDQAFRDTVKRAHPMGAARIVRRERYAWPGGYPLVLVLTDGAVLCPACVSSEWASISSAHRHKSRDGWRPSAIDYVEAPEVDVVCDHCSTVIASAD